ncbi:hypothetical protein SESBI_10544 [Sesbania bispinosa]|nr:hypothetical protein SESBI_10544 [Sesbania bispinosa]
MKNLVSVATRRTLIASISCNRYISPPPAASTAFVALSQVARTSSARSQIVVTCSVVPFLLVAQSQGESRLQLVGSLLFRG